MRITELISTIAEDIRTIDKHHLMVMLHLTHLITNQEQNVPGYVVDLQVIVSAELLKRGVSIAEL